MVKVEGKLATLLLGEICGVAPHERHEPTALGCFQVDVPPGREKLLCDEANDVEAIGHNQRVAKVLGDQRAVGGRQIYADHANLLFALT